MIAIVDEAPDHTGAREALLDLSFGEERFTKTSERLREGRLPVLAFAALDDAGTFVGTVRLWSVIDRKGAESLLLGPLAVAPGLRGARIGDRLMRHALTQAAIYGHGSVILVGDLGYYARFGFSSGLLDKVTLPGPVAHARFLGVDLVPGHLAMLEGALAACGEPSGGATYRASIPEDLIVTSA